MLPLTRLEDEPKSCAILDNYLFPSALFALYSKKTAWQSALAGIVSGTIALIAWKHCGIGKYMYEIVPGFLTNMIVIFIVNFFVEPDAETENIFSHSMQVYTERLK
jgi:Na+/proline symporter